MARIDVVGAGIMGLWQAFMLRRAGHAVSLWDRAGLPSSASASLLAGAMLAPYCEGEPGHEAARDLGIESLELWKALYPDVVMNGSLVVALSRDQADFERFAAVTNGHRRTEPGEVFAIEPALEARFQRALFYSHEGHVEPPKVLDFLLRECGALGVRMVADDYRDDSQADMIVDCRGLAAKDSLKTLRGVRGERLLLECPELALQRPVRLLHPRVPFYIVPWSGGRFMVGATVIESEDSGQTTLRSAAELMSLAYALLPALGEARILDMGAGVRPSFPDNAPKIVVRGRRVFVNGAYRHGFLLAPILASLTADYIERGVMRDGVVVEDHGEW